MIRHLFVAVLSVTCLTQCSMLGRLLQVPMRTLNTLTRTISEEDSTKMMNRAQKVQQRPEAAPKSPEESRTSNVAQR
jgi:hypothetical protein